MAGESQELNLGFRNAVKAIIFKLVELFFATSFIFVVGIGFCWLAIDIYFDLLFAMPALFA